jgi:hypothetical protein
MLAGAGGTENRTTEFHTVMIELISKGEANGERDRRDPSARASRSAISDLFALDFLLDRGAFRWSAPTLAVGAPGSLVGNVRYVFPTREATLNIFRRTTCSGCAMRRPGSKRVPAIRLHTVQGSGATAPGRASCTTSMN